MGGVPWLQVKAVALHSDLLQRSQREAHKSQSMCQLAPWGLDATLDDAPGWDEHAVSALKDKRQWPAAGYRGDIRWRDGAWLRRNGRG